MGYETLMRLFLVCSMSWTSLDKEIFEISSLLLFLLYLADFFLFGVMPGGVQWLFPALCLNVASDIA